MGHPEPFDLRYVAIGNEECGLKNYLGWFVTVVTFSLMLCLNFKCRTDPVRSSFCIELTRELPQVS